MKKLISIALLIAVVATMAIVSSAGSLGQKFPRGDVAYVQSGSIAIDGEKDDAYLNGAVIVTDTYHARYVGENGSMNTTYLLWDGTYLYIYTEAKDNTPAAGTLVQYLTASYDTECVEYFIVWDNSDCPDTETYDPDSSQDLFQYRVCYESTGHGGWWVVCGEDGTEGYADGAEETAPFSDAPGYWKAGKMVPTAQGYNIEGQLVMPKSNRAGLGSYNYGEGWKIGFITQQFDWINGCGNYDGLTVLVTEVGSPSQDAIINKSSAWDVAYYDYVELKGIAAPADTTEAPANTTEAPADTTEAPADTQAPDATKAPVQTNPQTSDMAVAGVAILVTLALAGVVVTKKIK